MRQTNRDERISGRYSPHVSQIEPRWAYHWPRPMSTRRVV